MSFFSDDPLDGEHNVALEQLMKTEEGRVLAQQIKDKLKELSQTYEGLNDGDKEEFASIFTEKFKESFVHLKEKVADSVKEKVEDADFREGFKKNVLRKVASDDWFQNYNVAIVAVVIFLAIFG